MSSEQKLRIFISHRFDDKLTADVIRRTLARWGFDDIYQAGAPGSGPRVGDSLTDELRDVLERRRPGNPRLTFTDALPGHSLRRPRSHQAPTAVGRCVARTGHRVEHHHQGARHPRQGNARERFASKRTNYENFARRLREERELELPLFEQVQRRHNVSGFFRVQRLLEPPLPSA